MPERLYGMHYWFNLQLAALNAQQTLQCNARVSRLVLVLGSLFVITIRASAQASKQRCVDGCEHARMGEVHANTVATYLGRCRRAVKITFSCCVA